MLSQMKGSSLIIAGEIAVRSPYEYCDVASSRGEYWWSTVPNNVAKYGDPWHDETHKTDEACIRPAALDK